MGVENDGKCSGDSHSKTAWKGKRFAATAQNDIKENIETVRIQCELRGYKILSKIVGTGAYATVFLANVHRNKHCESSLVITKLEKNDIRVVAIKVIDRSNVPSEFLRSFLPRELENHLTLPSHMNVVECFEHFSSEDYEFMVLEYCCNGDLLDRINWYIHRKERGLPEAMSKKVFYQLCLAVRHCHDNHVVHRDLKCENVLLDEEDNVKLTDFGFSIRVSYNRSLRTACGSFAYAAPEVTSGKSYNGRKADIWSLGVILFAMANGRLPFPENKQTASADAPPDSVPTKRTFKYAKHVPPDCMILINKMLTEDPDKRPSLTKILKHMWVNLDTRPPVFIPISSVSTNSPTCVKSIVKSEESPKPSAMKKPCRTCNCSAHKKPAVTQSADVAATACGDSKSLANKFPAKSASSLTKPSKQRSKSAATANKSATFSRPRTVTGTKSDAPTIEETISKGCQTDADIIRFKSGRLKDSETPDIKTFAMKRKPGTTKVSHMSVNSAIGKCPQYTRAPLLSYRLFDISNNDKLRNTTPNPNNKLNHEVDASFKTINCRNHLRERRLIKLKHSQHERRNNRSSSPTKNEHIKSKIPIKCHELRKISKEMESQANVEVSHAPIYEDVRRHMNNSNASDYQNRHHSRTDVTNSEDGNRSVHNIEISNKNNSAPNAQKECHSTGDENTLPTTHVIPMVTDASSTYVCDDVQGAFQLPLITPNASSTPSYAQAVDTCAPRINHSPPISAYQSRVGINHPLSSPRRLQGSRKHDISPVPSHSPRSAKCPQREISSTQLDAHHASAHIHASYPEPHGTSHTRSKYTASSKSYTHAIRDKHTDSRLSPYPQVGASSHMSQRAISASSSSPHPPVTNHPASSSKYHKGTNNIDPSSKYPQGTSSTYIQEVKHTASSPAYTHGANHTTSSSPQGGTPTTSSSSCLQGANHTAASSYQEKSKKPASPPSYQKGVNTASSPSYPPGTNTTSSTYLQAANHTSASSYQEESKNTASQPSYSQGANHAASSPPYAPMVNTASSLVVKNISSSSPRAAPGVAKYLQSRASSAHRGTTHAATRDKYSTLIPGAKRAQGTPLSPRACLSEGYATPDIDQYFLAKEFARMPTVRPRI